MWIRITVAIVVSVIVGVIFNYPPLACGLAVLLVGLSLE